MAEYTLHDLYLLAKLPAAKSRCVPLSLSQSRTPAKTTCNHRRSDKRKHK